MGNLSLYASTSCMMTHRWRGDKDRENKAHCDLNYAWTENETYQPPLYQIAKIQKL